MLPILTQKPAIRNFASSHSAAKETAIKILTEIMTFRRVSKSGVSCRGVGCSCCVSIHLPKILSAVKRNEPVFFVLPAFPGKSPNLEKVLSPLPDHAERLSLAFLGTLCQQVKKYYFPGIRILLCSDGRVFSDVVGMKETHVSAYQHELDKLIDEMSLCDLSTFNLDHCYESLSFQEMRDRLMSRYGNSLSNIKQKIRNGSKPFADADDQEANRMYCGITRFLFEDSLYTGQMKSRSAIQKAARDKAYEVIRRSNAWSELIAERFPEAIRLSIHPQVCGSKKLGIRLIANERWMTPWHGVAVGTGKGYILLKRSQAEGLGATLIHSDDGRPSHYLLNESTEIIHEF
ncbi:pyoverdine biosynthesis protein PvcA [Legionella quinlivanii]|uniref:Pyoverdine biosynthesis protein PvcA n=1 Tax=Legionella quinlivanii TaxID=45073 RepID=A0A364LM13_9GAMM|nr:isocyanide synthase family protein [Legionella quinlivanii]RAP37568.1 pyoverdine biosynthesis protein PvcA [Legionella quinlivanii]